MDHVKNHQPERARGSSTYSRLTALGLVVAIVTSMGSLYYSYRTSLEADENQRRVARQTIVAAVLQMGEIHRKREDNFSNEILLLARDAETLINDFRGEDLNLDPATYRQISEYVAFSTSDMALATRMASAAVDDAAPTDVEVVRARRVLGSIAAQDADLEALRTQFAAALRVAEAITSEEPTLGGKVARQTRAFRLLAVYLGVKKAPDANRREQFCAAANEWRADLAAVHHSMHLSFVTLQIHRIAGPTATDADLSRQCGSVTDS
jgi:type II secretory pathway component PulJ